jgi:tripartite-type tricarboxylate transporter receptor subunit TctC
MLKRRFVQAALAAPFAMSSAARVFAAANSFPDRSVTLVVPFASGGATDVVGRITAEALSARWGQTVIVDNKPGANTLVGTAYVARAKPDGYTLVLGATGTIANRYLYKTLPYDADSIVPVALLAYTPLMLYLRSSLPATNLDELRAFVKQSGKPMTFATTGAGSTPDLAATWFSSHADIPILKVPYKGSALSLNDVLGGQVDALFSVENNRQHAESGKLRAIFVAQPERLATWPSLPSARDVGLGDYSMTAWYALFASTSVPAPIREQISSDFNTALRDEATRKRYLEASMQTMPMSPAETRTFFAKQDAELKRLIVENHIVVE